MSQFSDRDFFGYRVCVRPDDWLRKRTVMPKLHFTVVPYFSGSDISFSLCVKPNKERSPSTLKYTWHLRKKGEEEPCNSGSGIAVVSNEKYPTKLFLGHFSFTDEYMLDLKVTRGDEQESQNVADFEVTSRATLLKDFWLVILALVIGIIIGKVA